MPDTKTVADKLREPFSAKQIGKLPRVVCGVCSDRDKTCTEHKRLWCKVCKATVSEKHIHIDYVGHADVTSRLLEVDPSWNWQPVAVDHNGLPVYDTDKNGNPVGLWIRLTIGEITRLGYGSCPSGQRDAVKVLIGDALRNAAMRFGVALDLWAKGDRDDPEIPGRAQPTHRVRTTGAPHERMRESAEDRRRNQAGMERAEQVSDEQFMIPVPDESPDENNGMATNDQVKTIVLHGKRFGFTDSEKGRAERLAYFARIAGTDELGSAGELTHPQAAKVIDVLTKTKDRKALDALLNGKAEEVPADAG